MFLKKILSNNKLLFLILILIFIFITFIFRNKKSKIKNNEHKEKKNNKIAISLLTRKPIDFPLWLKHHRELGISKFFISIEDTPSLEEYLKTQEDVQYESGKSDKENNYKTLQDRQMKFVNKCLKESMNSDIKWIFHIDSDELLNGSLEFLDKLDDKYKTIHMENVEATFTGDESSCFSSKKFLKCSRGAPCRSYANGKAGGRVLDGVYLSGPHNFYYKGKYEDYNYEVPFDVLHVLHFDSCSFGSWVEKFKHLGKKNEEKIPFPYYNESINFANKAFEKYIENTGIKDNLPSEMIYKK